MMEVFAGFLTHTDYHIGRVLDYLKSIGEFDNTLIMVISDNGASAEGGPGGTTNEIQFFNNAQETLEESLAKLDKLGGPETFNHYPWGWTWAGNTPFRRWKRETYRGGTSDPFIVHWPSGIKAKGEIRTQYAHAIDMLPTILEVLSIEPPTTIKGVTQSPIEGVSFAHSFDDADAPTRHQTQYFEMFGHRSLYHDGWRAVCPWPGPSFTEAGKGCGAQGGLICQGTGAGGFAFYVKDGKLRYAHNYVSRAIFSVASQETVPQGRHQLRFEFEPTGNPDIPHGKGTAGRGQLYIDGRLVGDADIPYTTPVIFNPGGLTCGANPGLPVTPEYASPFKFTGKIYGVTVDVSGDLIKDSEAELRLVMARQ